MGTKGQNLGLAFLASTLMATSTAQAQQQVLCTRDLNTDAVICPEQHRRVYAPTGPTQPQPPVVVEQPNPVATAVIGTALAVGTAVLIGRAFNGSSGHHGHHGALRYVAPADRYYRDNRWGSVDPHGNIYRNPYQGCLRTDRGSVICN